jgi:hypothetical protein
VDLGVKSETTTTTTGKETSKLHKERKTRATIYFKLINCIERIMQT